MKKRMSNLLEVLSVHGCFDVEKSVLFLLPWQFHFLVLEGPRNAMKQRKNSKLV